MTKTGTKMATVTSVTTARDAVMHESDEDREALETIIGLLEQYPDLARRLAIVLRLAGEGR